MSNGQLDPNLLHLDRPGAITTISGRIVEPLDMRVTDLDILDIAHALAMQCRYNGHSTGHLSVARHSLWVANECAALGPEHELLGLLHDASEAYLGDMVRPMKHSPAMEPFRQAEARLEALISERWQLKYPHPKYIHAADNAVAAEEIATLRWKWNSSWRSDELEFINRFETLILRRYS